MDVCRGHRCRRDPQHDAGDHEQGDDAPADVSGECRRHEPEAEHDHRYGDDGAMARRRDPGAHHREAGREEEPHGDQDADQHHLAEPRPDALGHGLAGPVVFGEGDRQHQVGEQAGPSEEEGDHEEDPHQRGVEADVLGEAARDAPDLPIVSRPEERAPGADLFVFSLFCLVVFWLFGHGTDDDGPGPDRLSGITPNRPPSSPRRTTPGSLYARGMAERRIVGSHFNRQGKPKRGYVKEEVAKAEAARFGMTYYRCDVCERFHLTSK